MSRWFRHYAGMMRDEKLVSAALKSKQPVERVVWVWGAILESAAEINDGGRYEIDHGEIAYFLRADEGDIRGIETALAVLGRVSENRVGKWGERQFLSDSSAERQKRYRERHSNKNKTSPNVTVTSPSRSSDAPETETETERERETRARTHDEFLKVATIDPDDPAFFGSRYQIEALLSRGFSPETILAGAARAMNGKSKPPSIAYFVKCIESENDERSAPAKKEIHGNGKTESLPDVARRLSASGIDFGPRPDAIRGRPDSPPVRLLSKG